MKAFRILILLILAIPVFAQEIPVDVNNISDQQLAQIMVRYQLQGKAPEEIEQVMKLKGLPPEQILILNRRIAEMDPLTGDSMNSYKSKTRDENSVPRKKIKIIPPYSSTDNQSVPSEDKLSIFGMEIFDNQNLSFEPNLTISTPRNYVIGVGDELIIDIFGLSESTKKLKVTTEGYIRFPNLGPIKVAGLSIEEAQAKIREMAIKIYTTIEGGGTKVMVSLGQLRSIQVTLVGEVKRPGNYTISSLSTLMNALYASGGPSELGSMRKVELVRNGKTITILDIYDFLFKGDLSKNKLLQDGDVIRVGNYDSRVAVIGEVKTNAFFDVKNGENAADILRYAGGFSDEAFKERIRIKRMGTKGLEIHTISMVNLSSAALTSGDTLIVDALARTYTNRIIIDGAVYYPGEYGLNEFTNLKELLTAVRVKENASTERALLSRLNPDLTPSMLPFNVKDVLSGKTDIRLQREDKIHIYPITSLREAYSVTINGEVNRPATFTFADNMRVQDLILLSDGFKEGASRSRIEVSRRLLSNSSSDTTAYSIIHSIDLGSSSAEELNFILKPFDIVSVRKSPSYRTQITVSVEGEVLYPGNYTLSGNKERLSDIIARSGGLKQTGYATGAILLRKTHVNQTSADEALFSSKINTISNQSKRSSGNSFAATDTAKIASNVNGLLVDQKPVGIRLAEAMESPGSLYDIILEEGDVIKVPKLTQTVQTFGAVNVPRQIAYHSGLGFRRLISESGWFAPNASRRYAYMVRPNGEIKTTKRLLFFRFYPSLEPGAEVYVPAKKDKRSISTPEYIAMGTGIASLAGLIIALINTVK
jgi:protein involved in polysaccharide export with SLBB domain